MESTNVTEQPRALHSEKQSLSSIHLSWGFPTDDELLWLFEQGVDENALWPISGSTVCFDAGTFELNDDGQRALIFRAEDRAEVIDLIAWQPQTGKVASWRVQAFCLGDIDDIFNPATYFAAMLCASTRRPLIGSLPTERALWLFGKTWHLPISRTAHESAARMRLTHGN